MYFSWVALKLLEWQNDTFLILNYVSNHISGPVICPQNSIPCGLCTSYRCSQQHFVFDCEEVQCPEIHIFQGQKLTNGEGMTTLKPLPLIEITVITIYIAFSDFYGIELKSLSLWCLRSYTCLAIFLFLPHSHFLLVASEKHPPCLRVCLRRN